MSNDGRLVQITTFRPAAREGHDARRQAECVRLLRNEVSDNLTRSQSNKEITADDQWTWWRSPDALAREIIIVETCTVEEPDPVFVGFGMIQIVENQGWLTGAIRQQHRGKGHGRALFRRLLQECRVRNLVPWLEVFADNEVAKALYVSLGFQWRDCYGGPGVRRILVGQFVGVV